jgi:hypothetical protein
MVRYDMIFISCRWGSTHCHWSVNLYKKKKKKRSVSFVLERAVKELFTFYATEVRAVTSLLYEHNI